MRSWTKLIQSSVSVAFLGITSWATTYCYGWGEALYYGYPWWHVAKGPDSVARSMAYVCVTSFALIIGYGIGYLLLRGVKRSNLFQNIGCLRIFILLSVLFFPIVVEFYIFAGYISGKFIAFFLIVALILSAIFHKTGNTFSLDIMKIKNKEQHSFIFTVFIFLYFTILAFCIGYIRPYFRTTYDKIIFDNQQYYILACNGDMYVLGKKTKNNKTFIFFNHNTLKGYKVDVVELPSPLS
ncbi:Uncharacterised protein [Neisseria animaloris]|uniref:Uncharacterized protein n=1 Tax=Neisseria animaloris TaxID=326522 RepID=A0A1X3CMA3_9NEIS|nr:hypothetical protein [Neisseria animaloris]MDO5074030.1 hypothetical protein [Neisseria animaloris]OSI08673.1 hypothetical protein BWD08_00670 [Neisseria animaloris]VEH87378.1 Uncharacterised protein [Neisseria animaloris]VEJ20479.1 Uncharacterised protein [Neisseria animaloris]